MKKRQARFNLDHMLILLSFASSRSEMPSNTLKDCQNLTYLYVCLSASPFWIQLAHSNQESAIRAPCGTLCRWCEDANAQAAKSAATHGLEPRLLATARPEQSGTVMDNSIMFRLQLNLLHLFCFIINERFFWVFCICVSSSPFGFHRPRCNTSAAASWTFSQPWKRPRWLSVPTALGKAWWTSWNNISFQRCLPPNTKAMTLCSTGQVRPGSCAKNSFQGREWVKLVMNIQAAEKPIRAKKDTVNMNLHPSLNGRPKGYVPRSHTQTHKLSTKPLCFKRRGTHLFQKSLLHLPPAPSSGKCILSQTFQHVINSCFTMFLPFKSTSFCSRYTARCIEALKTSVDPEVT